MDIHPDVEPLAWLLGTWRGEGDGSYPTIAGFRYREEATWSHVGKPFLVYSQSTWAIDDGRPLHGERGYLRVAAGQMELVLAHSSGLVEVALGAIGPALGAIGPALGAIGPALGAIGPALGAIDDALVLTSTTIIGTPSAKEVRAVDRRMWRSGPLLRYELGMAAVGQTHQGHLRANLAQS
jgi:THAP4-like, heme-binding beta-barrel domain